MKNSTRPYIFPRLGTRTPLPGGWEEIHLTTTDLDLLYLSIFLNCCAIAKLLHVTEACIKKRKRSICEKLGVLNFMQAVCRAAGLGLIALDDDSIEAYLSKFTHS